MVRENDRAFERIDAVDAVLLVVSWAVMGFALTARVTSVVGSEKPFDVTVVIVVGILVLSIAAPICLWAILRRL